MASFEQLEIYFSQIDAGSPATSAQSNWMAGAAEARELAAELQKNLSTLSQYWSGPAATEFTGAMNAIIEFANKLAEDMTDMSTGLATMASTAASIQPQALSIINAARSNPYSRAAAIAPLNALLAQLSQSYQSNKSQYWKQPSQEPKQLPKSGSEGTATPSKTERPKDVESAPILGEIADIVKYLTIAESAYQAFNEEEFPSGVTGEYSPGEVPGGYDGSIGDGSGPGGNDSLPSLEDPDYQPLPEPESELTESPVNLAGATPTGLAGGSPALSLATPSSSGMGAPGGAMPMAMGMGAAGAVAGAGRQAAPARPGGSGGMGLFGPPMGAARQGQQDDSEEPGVRTWLTEDELAWDAEDAPAGVVGNHPND